ncbi:hypothetical protein BJY01DRAFT_258587 [Aspergillus pseudoustus]|uniref:F-box domain-containing protein n=1 Tax=Aspergillus pseudoustus TaxID=1810923 RepID=A0ABR4J9Z0_9EURO
MARGLADLPVEVIHLIAGYLPNSGIKTLRRTCRTLCNSVRLRLDRVFLSANPLNLTVFRAIAGSEAFRYGITEIIWDDARLIEEPLGEFHPDDEREYHRIDPETGCPYWFVHACRDNIDELRRRKGFHRNINRGRTPPEAILRANQIADAELPRNVSWQYYQNLFQQQQDIIVFNKDADAFIHGLRQFPNLKRVTVTPAAHGWIYTPLYETPMIRAFPKGFNYPIPRGWPDFPGWGDKPRAEPWEGESSSSARQAYRGVCIATRALASYPELHHVSELSIDAHTLETALNSRVFEEPNTEYNDFATILRQPGFARLDLSLLVGGQEFTGWLCFRNRYLRRALEGAADLEHISLSTNVDFDPAADATVEGTAGSRAQLVPLCTIFPVEQWCRLRHFALSNFLVDNDDLILFLSALPFATLRSIHLGLLHFVDHGGSFHALLQDMRDKLDWRTRTRTRDVPPSARPSVSIAVPTTYLEIGHAIWLEEELNVLQPRVNGIASRLSKKVTICDVQLGLGGNWRYPAFPSISSYAWDGIENGIWDSISRYWGNSSDSCASWAFANLTGHDTRWVSQGGNLAQARANYQTEHVFEGQLIGDFFTRWLDQGLIKNQRPSPLLTFPRFSCGEILDFFMETDGARFPWQLGGRATAFINLLLTELNVYGQRANRPDHSPCLRILGMIINYLNDPEAFSKFCGTYEGIYAHFEEWDRWHASAGYPAGRNIPSMRDEWREYIRVVLDSLIIRSRATFDYMLDKRQLFRTSLSDPPYDGHWFVNRFINRAQLRLSYTCIHMDPHRA